MRLLTSKTPLAASTSVLLTAIAVGLTAPDGSGGAASCNRGVDTGDGNPRPTPNAGDLFVGHRLLLAGALAPKTHEFRDRPGGWWWLKTLAMVGGRGTVTISVPRSERSRLHLRYLHDSRTVTFRPCRRPAGQWSYYPGGFVYSKRGCYAIEIRLGGGDPVRRRIPLGVGARCAGP